ncbi:putative membrane protein [Methyloversatilis sp. RAC08]|uniref:hypothetical protein n=1 Tax=Methyloversatilis sp. RAC08 TaxID=1842540 RepID=UPI00083D5CEB|nr:hypothetical protein [Methyloversatilis sp. RAC08]AOF81144.1 putative membrane protein [Methyloversatilis sp. RAC08]
MVSVTTPALWRTGIAVCALLALSGMLVGIATGLARFGVPIPAVPVALHGAMMICAVFGTVISLERAVALQRLPGLLSPLAAGLGGLVAWTIGSVVAAQLLWAFAAAVLVLLYIHAGRSRAWSLHLMVEMAGAACWLIGVLVWAAGDLSAAVICWVAFLVLTIAGERRELMQMIRLPRVARVLFGLAVAMVLLAVVLSPLRAGPAALLLWLACALLALWLLRWDMAPRKWAAPGWPGHVAQCLTVGYVWLLVGALLGLYGALSPGALPAAGLHAVLLGFVLAMVFGHAPIMLPALLRLRPVYSAWARVPLWLLAASLLLRLGASSAGDLPALALAGVGHAVAIVLFGVVMVAAVRRKLS